MNSHISVQDHSSGRPAAVRLYLHSHPESEGIFWRINGFRATLFVWTSEEWNRLESRPNDAQLHPSGVWCALRLE